MFFNNHSLAKYQKIEGRPFGGIKSFFRKVPVLKNGGNLTVSKNENGDPSALKWFCILCYRLYALKIKYL